MKRNRLEGRNLAEVKEGIERAAAYATEHKVPLTVERLAAELGISVTVLREYLREEYEPPPRAQKVVEAVRQAADEATASVMEYALTRGSSPNMHMMYLKQYAGYGEREVATGGTSVVFCGEEEI